MKPSKRWEALRDAAARASWVVYEAEEALSLALDAHCGQRVDDVVCAEAVLRSARSLRALALWELRKQGRADERVAA